MKAKDALGKWDDGGWTMLLGCTKARPNPPKIRREIFRRPAPVAGGGGLTVGRWPRPLPTLGGWPLVSVGEGGAHLASLAQGVLEYPTPLKSILDFCQSPIRIHCLSEKTSKFLFFFFTFF